MAPKKGGSSSSGSSSGGGSNCYGCSETLHLVGNGWTEANTNALFAFHIICVLVLLVCLVLSSRAKWVAKAGKNRLRRAGFITATCFILLYDIIRIVDTALYEETTYVTYLYYIIYIFQSLSWRIGELLILAIIVRQIYESSESTLVNPLRTFNKIAIVILTILSLAGFGLYSANTVISIIDGEHYYYSTTGLNRSGNYVDFSYQVLYFVIALVVVVFGALVFVKERSKAAFIMVAVIAPSLFLRSLIDFVAQAVFTWPGNTTEAAMIKLSWANTFLDVILISFIFSAVAFVSTLKPRNSNLGLQQKPYESMVPIEYAQNGAPTAYQAAQQPHFHSGTATTYSNGQQTYNSGGSVAPSGSAAPGAYHQTLP